MKSLVIPSIADSVEIVVVNSKVKTLLNLRNDCLIESSKFKLNRRYMRCPSLNELSPPPPGKTGWPWTEESPQLPDSMPDGTSWPKISIVTPSLNQGQFIEETIRSVLLQGYPNLEYIIIDGGSTDDSVNIIKKYKKWLSYWMSEADKGQTNAINKGLKIATGEFVTWFNSDDFYENSIMDKISRLFREFPNIDIVYGNKKRVDVNGKLINTNIPEDFNFINLLFYNYIPQESCFWRRSIHEKLGYLSEQYIYAMDYEMWIRCGIKKNIVHINEFLANQRVHPASKTTMNREIGVLEHLDILKNLFIKETELPSEVRIRKNKVLSHINERVAHWYFDRDQKKSRKYFIKAMYSTPLRIQNFTLILYLIDTIVGSSLGRFIQGLRKNEK